MQELLGGFIMKKVLRIAKDYAKRSAIVVAMPKDLYPFGEIWILKYVKTARRMLNMWKRPIVMRIDGTTGEKIEIIFARSKDIEDSKLYLHDFVKKVPMGSEFSVFG